MQCDHKQTFSMARAFTSPWCTAPSPARTLDFCFSHRPLSSWATPPLSYNSSGGSGFPTIGNRWSSPAPISACAASKATDDTAPGGSAPTTDLTGLYKRVLLPIIDRNPYLSEATRQAAATTTALAKKYGADITVVVIDEDSKESIADHDLRIKNIRWHLAEVHSGGFEEFGLMESMGEGKRPAAVIGEIADDLSLDLVVLSMETIHSKHIDGNLLAEFVPCPILLLPL